MTQDQMNALHDAHDNRELMGSHPKSLKEAIAEEQAREDRAVELTLSRILREGKGLRNITEIRAHLHDLYNIAYAHGYEGN